MRVVKLVFKKLNENTAYILLNECTKIHLLWVEYFKRLSQLKMGGLNFNFPTLQHHIFELQQNFYIVEIKRTDD